MTFLEIPGVSYIGLGYKLVFLIRLLFWSCVFASNFEAKLRARYLDRPELEDDSESFYIFLIFGSLSCEASPQEFWNSFGASLPSTAGAICVRLQEWGAQGECSTTNTLGPQRPQGAESLGLTPRRCPLLSFPSHPGNLPFWYLAIRRDNELSRISTQQKEEE